MNVASELSMYIFIRFFSFLTYTHPVANQIIAFLVILAFIYICIKNLKSGWGVLIGELLLDGAGHFFELNNLLLRTWFLGIFGLVWFITKLKRKETFVKLNKYVNVSIAVFLITVIWSSINGFLHNNSSTFILQDAILYFFILLIFPALEFEHYTKKFLSIITQSWIIGTAIFSSISFFIYSIGIGFLPDKYYHWFRNIASGKITDLGNQFFRIVLPEHLFVVPIILIIMAYLIQQPKNKKLWFLLSGCIIIITLNFSRIYWLGLFVGVLVLAFKHFIKRWLVISSITLISIPILFSSLHFLSSQGKSFGFELLGLRIGGVKTMQSDTSGAIRLAILPDIFRTIKNRPWLGSGLGTTISYIDPVSHQPVIRSQYDWGYLEIITKLGILGTAVFLLFFFLILRNVARVAYSNALLNEETPLVRGVFAGATALLVMNITTPALFQGFGILYIVFMMVIVQKKDHASSKQSL